MKKLISCIAVMFVFYAISTTAQIKIDKAKGVLISQAKTYFVVQGQVVSSKHMSKSGELHIFEIVRSGVETELNMRGYTAAGSDSTADLVISYLYDVSEKIAPKAGPLGQTPITNPGSIGMEDQVRVSENRVLVLDIEHHDSSIWTANCTMNPAVQDIDKLISNTIISAFRRFPVQGKGK